MTLGRSVFGAIATAIAIAASPASHAAHAAPAHDALVIGNGTYESLPPLPACLLSAHAVSAALRNAGFEVVEREDATSGGTDAAIGEASRSFAAAPGATAFVYVCAYASALNDRAFLLPTSAHIARPSDLLTQGVLAKSLLTMLTRGGVRSAVLALDIFPAPGAPATLALDAAVQGDLPDGLGAIAVSQAIPPGGPTPLAAALVANLKATTVQIGPLLAAVQQQLAASKAVTIAAVHAPAGPSYLLGGPSPAPSAPPAPSGPPAPSAPPPSAQAAAPPAQEAAASSTPTGATVPPPTAAASPLPADAQMTDADRRRVQTALARLGYYDGKVDGVFGPDTRAAIRRYQHELHADMTGQLTQAQANRLVGGG
jgi:hypothetical protein